MKGIVIATATTIIASLFMGDSVYTEVEINALYPRAMYVSELNMETDELTLVDGAGLTWEYKGIEDYYVGDYVCAIMDDNGTPNSIYDDKIVSMRATGFTR